MDSIKPSESEHSKPNSSGNNDKINENVPIRKIYIYPVEPNVSFFYLFMSIVYHKQLN